MNWIDDAQLERLAQPLKKSGYGSYLLKLLSEVRPAPSGVFHANQTTQAA
jgi:hypothetical protein